MTMRFGRLERQIIGLVIGCTAKFVTGSLFVFNVYQDAIKDTFNYTQKEIESMSSLLNVGLGVGFVPGAMFDRFGPQWTSVAGLLISVPAYLLLWSSSKFVPFYSRNSWLMAIYFFLCGFGSVFTYMVALNTNIINFGKKYVVIIIGTLNAFFAGSPSIFSVIYYNQFTHGDRTDTANQDFPGFMMMFAISFAVSDILCVIFMRVEKQSALEVNVDAFDSTNAIAAALSESTASVSTIEKAMDSPVNNSNELPVAQPPDSPFAERKAGNQTVVVDEETSKNVYPYSDIPLSVKQLFFNIDYHIVVWHVAFVSSIGLVFVNNITVISKSLHLESYDNRLTIIIPITNAVLSISVGLFSYFFRNHIPKVMIVNFGTICFIVSQITVLLFANHIAILELSTVLVGVGIGIIWSMFPAIIQEMFYVGNIGRNWGIAILVASALGFGAQEIFGVLYDHEISVPGETHCYGMSCFRGGTIVSIVFGGMSLFLGIVTQLRRWWLNKYVNNS